MINYLRFISGRNQRSVLDSHDWRRNSTFWWKGRFWESSC